MGERVRWRIGLGWIVLRVLVPLWLVTGAAFKFLENSPANLPEPVIKMAGALGLDLGFVLHYSVAVELVVAGVILLLPRLARKATIALLGFFAVILVWETVTGAATCGCFGSVTVPPWVTLLVDGSLLVAVVLLAPRGREFDPPTPARTAVALLWTLAVFAVAFGVRLPAQGVAADPAPEPSVAGASTSGVVAPVPSYYLPEYDGWIGKRWEELEIAQWVRDVPGFLRSADGTAFVFLYRKDCEHCHDLLSRYFPGDPPFPTLLVAVPEKEGFPREGVLPNPCTGCVVRELPKGCDWFFQTPVVIRFENGVVTCVAEEDPSAPRCVDW